MGLLDDLKEECAFMNQKSAVVIIDVQNVLCAGEYMTFDAEAVIAHLNSIMHKARIAGVPVIVIQHETTSGLFVYQSEGWQIPETLECHSSDIYVRKQNSDAFHHTKLKALLDQLQVDHLIIGGMQSEFCVDSTIRRALALEYAITVISDGHTTLDNAVLSAKMISQHHNYTWQHLSSYTHSAHIARANQINF